MNPEKHVSNLFRVLIQTLNIEQKIKKKKKLTSKMYDTQ